MNNKYVTLYNNLIKLTRNKTLYLNLARQFNGVTIQFHTGFGVSLGSIAWGSTASNFSSIVNVYGDANYGNYTFTAPAIGTRERGWINGRRPAKGLQYPRGYYNK